MSPDEYVEQAPAGSTLGHLLLAFEYGAWTYRQGMADVMTLDEAQRYWVSMAEREPGTPHAIVALVRVSNPEAPKEERCPPPEDREAVGGYRPGCAKVGCICHTPPRVCAEYLPGWQDEHCVRCGWVAAKHEAAL